MAAFLFSSSDQARGGFRHTGVESQLMEDELAALAYNPYRYAAGGLCDHAGLMYEHLAAAFGPALVMALWWRAGDDACPICTYLDDHVPDEPLLHDCAAEMSA